MKHIGYITLLFTLLFGLSACEQTASVELESIDIAAATLEDVYVLQDFNLGDISLKAIYDDGSVRYVPLESSMLTPNLAFIEAGTHQAIVSYEGFETTLELNIVANQEALLLYRFHQLGVFDESIEAGYDAWKDSLRASEIELQMVEERLYWRYDDAAEWTMLFDFSDFHGTDGTDGTDAQDIEFRVIDDALVWRYQHEQTWQHLYDLSKLEGGAPSDTIADFSLAKDGMLAVLSQVPEEGRVSLGSGMVYDASETHYYMFTNHHVIDNHERIDLYYERYGNRFEIPFEDLEVLGMSERFDIAVIRFSSDVTFPVTTFADSFALETVQPVYALGHPGDLMHFNSVTSGILSKQHVNMILEGTNAYFMKHDAPINPGNSGGPLLDQYGRIIGMNTLKSIGDNVEGQGYALPSNTMQNILAQLTEHGEAYRSFFGIMITSGIFECDAMRGVCVQDVTENTTAADLGLQPGDVIKGIQTSAMDAFLTIDNFYQFGEVMQSIAPHEPIRLMVSRDGDTFETHDEPLGIHPEDLED